MLIDELHLHANFRSIFNSLLNFMETIRKQNFTNVQKELLKLYAREVSEKELLEIRQLLANYFAKTAIVNADKVWDKNEYDEDWVNRMLNKED